MYSPKELEEFFSVYLPKTKAEIEGLWLNNRGELNEFLLEWLTMAADTWMQPYISDMLYLSKTGSHKYPNPWEIM